MRKSTHDESPAIGGESATVVRLGGRLLGIRVGDLRSPADWSRLGRTVREAVFAATGSVVVCTDLRGLRILPNAVQSVISASMRQTNLRLVRSAVLVPSDQMAAAFEPLRLEAAHAGRAVYLHPAEVKGWLSSCLDDAERSLLDGFL